ncbi:MAG: TRAP transporter small permease subunit [Shinella sp.]|nr:TRAP transporter small permease subunit [Shinella sp.]
MEPQMPDRQAPLLSLRRADEAIGVVALLAIVFSILWGVISRYIFPQPAAWTYELAIMAFAYLVFFGAVAGVRLGSHAAIDVLVAALCRMAGRRRSAGSTICCSPSSSF